MFARLVQDGHSEQVGDLLIGRSLAERSAEIDLTVCHQAGAKLSVRRQAQAIAREAEVIGDLADEPHGAERVRQPIGA